MTTAAERILIAEVIVDGHVDVLDTGMLQACVHIPGGYMVQVLVPPTHTPERALELGLKAVNQNLERILKMAPRAARRAYCLALGGGFDS